MANKHPYISSSGPLNQMIAQFRKSFPTVVDSEILKKLALAPKNESYLINIMRFLNLIGEDGKRTPEAGKVFVLHNEQEFQGAFEKVVKTAYSDLFALHGEGAWSLNQEALITYFRQSDQTTDLVGRRQANTFQTLAAAAGRRPQVSASASAAKPAAKKTATPKKAEPSKKTSTPEPPAKPLAEHSFERRNIGLTVRIEINLPTQGDQATYDRIFKSIRENFFECGVVGLTLRGLYGGQANSRMKPT